MGSTKKIQVAIVKEIISCPNFETNSPKQYCTRLIIDNSAENPQVDNRVLSNCQI